MCVIFTGVCDGVAVALTDVFDPTLAIGLAERTFFAVGLAAGFLAEVNDFEVLDLDDVTVGFLAVVFNFFGATFVLEVVVFLPTVEVLFTFLAAASIEG